MSVILYIFILSSAVQIIFYSFFYYHWVSVVQLTVNTQSSSISPPVSVVICAKNEEGNLRKYLAEILAQDYPVFEVIVVNDGSTDGTADLLAFFQKKYTHLVILTLGKAKRDMAGKKFALTKGIQSSKYPHLLLTDADCRPASKDWIRLMMGHFSEKKQIVLGYAPYEIKKGLLNKFIQFETLYTALQYLSFALMGHPYMGVGRNIAYHKSLFQKNNGFNTHRTILSGDDDLFINQIATAQNTAICIHPNTFCYSQPPTSYYEWYQQKSRHLSAGKHYKLKYKFLLGLLSLSHFLFYGTLIVALVLKTHYITIISLFSLRLLLQIGMYKILKQHLKHYLSVLFAIPILDCLYILYYCIFAPSLFLNRKISWTQTAR